MLSRSKNSEDLNTLINKHLNIIQRVEFSNYETPRKPLNYSEKIQKDTSTLTPNFAVLTAIATSQNEYIKNNAQELFDQSVAVEPTYINQLKTLLIESSKENQNTTNGESKIMSEESDYPKVIHVSSQALYQSDPKVFELEDKLEKLEQYYREKHKIDDEYNKKIHLAALDVSRAQMAVDIADQVLKDHDT